MVIHWLEVRISMDKPNWSEKFKSLSARGWTQLRKLPHHRCFFTYSNWWWSIAFHSYVYQTGGTNIQDLSTHFTNISPSCISQTHGEDRHIDLQLADTHRGQIRHVLAEHGVALDFIATAWRTQEWNLQPRPEQTCRCIFHGMYVCLSVWLTDWLSDWLSVWLTDCLSVCLTDWLTVCLYVCPSVCLSEVWYGMYVWMDGCMNAWMDE